MEHLLDRRTVFLDRDGTVNVRRRDPDDDLKNYVLTLQDFEWIPGALEAVVRLLDQGYAVVFVSNQSGISKGLAEHGTIQLIFDVMCSAILHEVSHPDPILEFYFCPHTADQGCECRKPKPGMFHAAAWDHGIRFKDAWCVGDAHTDTKGAWKAGIRKLIRLNSLEDPTCAPYSYELSSRTWDKRIADGVRIDNLVNAVDYILKWYADPLR